MGEPEPTPYRSSADATAASAATSAGGEAVPTPDATTVALENRTPARTIWANLNHPFVIGFFLTFATERLSLDPLWRLFFATGFLGAYTTFSSYTFEAAQLARDGAYGLALLYLFGSVAAGMAGVFVGILAAERL